MNATLIPLTTQVTFVTMPSTVTLKVTPTVVHTVVTVMMMITAVSIPLVLVMMTMLDIMISLLTTTKLVAIIALMVSIPETTLLYRRIPQIFQATNLSIHQMDSLTPLFLLEMPITLRGAQTQTQIQTPQFILMGVAIVKILSLQLILLHRIPIMMMVTMIVTCILVRNPSNLATFLMSAIILNPRAKTTVSGTTPNWMHNPQLG